MQVPKPPASRPVFKEAKGPQRQYNKPRSNYKPDNRNNNRNNGYKKNNNRKAFNRQNNIQTHKLPRIILVAHGMHLWNKDTVLKDSAILKLTAQVYTHLKRAKANVKIVPLGSTNMASYAARDILLKQYRVDQRDILQPGYFYNTLKPSDTLLFTHFETGLITTWIDALNDEGKLVKSIEHNRLNGVHLIKFIQNMNRCGAAYNILLNKRDPKDIISAQAYIDGSALGEDNKSELKKQLGNFLFNADAIFVHDPSAVEFAKALGFKNVQCHGQLVEFNKYHKPDTWYPTDKRDHKEFTISFHRPSRLKGIDLWMECAAKDEYPNMVCVSNWENSKYYAPNGYDDQQRVIKHNQGKWSEVDSPVNFYPSTTYHVLNSSLRTPALINAAPLGVDDPYGMAYLWRKAKQYLVTTDYSVIPGCKHLVIEYTMLEALERNVPLVFCNATIESARKHSTEEVVLLMKKFNESTIEEQRELADKLVNNRALIEVAKHLIMNTKTARDRDKKFKELHNKRVYDFKKTVEELGIPSKKVNDLTDDYLEQLKQLLVLYRSFPFITREELKPQQTIIHTLLNQHEQLLQKETEQEAESVSESTE